MVCEQVCTSINTKVKVVIVPRSDDGTYDLMEKLPNGKVDFIKNCDNLDKAKEERHELMRKPTQAETLQFFSDLKTQLSNHERKTASNRR